MNVIEREGNNTKADASILKFYLETLLVLRSDPLFSAYEHQLPAPMGFVSPEWHLQFFFYGLPLCHCGTLDYRGRDLEVLGNVCLIPLRPAQSMSAW